MVRGEMAKQDLRKPLAWLSTISRWLVTTSKTEFSSNRIARTWDDDSM